MSLLCMHKFNNNYYYTHCNFQLLFNISKILTKKSSPRNNNKTNEQIAGVTHMIHVTESSDFLNKKLMHISY